MPLNHTLLVVVRAARTMYRRASRDGGMVTRRDLDRAVSSKDRKEVPDLVDLALQYALDDQMLVEVDGGGYRALTGHFE